MPNIATYKSNITPLQVVPSTMAVNDPHTPLNNGRVLLYFINPTASAAAITILVPRRIDGLTIANKAVAVPNGQHVVVGPFDQATYNDPATGRMSFSSSVAGVTVSALEL